MSIDYSKPFIYFVLNGFVNGDEDMGKAVPCGGGNDPVMPDGWYFMFDGEDDPASNAGPFETRQIAKAKCDHFAKYWLSNYGRKLRGADAPYRAPWA